MPKNQEAQKENAPESAPVSKAINFTVKKNLTLPVLKMGIDKPVFIKFNEAMKIGKQIGDKDAALVAVVTNLETGETLQMLVPAVMQGVLHDEYGAPHYGTAEKGAPVTELEPRIEGQAPDSYVDKCFMITKHEKQSGKQYHPHTVQEIEVS